MDSNNNKGYRTVRYMKKKDLDLTNDNSSPELRQRLSGVEDDSNIVVRLRVNSPVYVEEALVLNTENIQKITEISE